MALSDNLVAYYSLEEASGTRVDATGRGNDLTPTATPGSTTGKVGDCINLVRASAQFLSRASTSDLQASGSFSFSVWVLLNTAGINQYILSKWGGSTNEYILRATSGNRFEWIVGATTITANTFGAPTTATWYHICCGYDAAATQGYISINNGTRDVNNSVAAPTVGTSVFRLGHVSFGADYWNGYVDECGKWARALSTTDQADLYNSGNGRDYAYITAAAAGQPAGRRMGLVDYAGMPLELGRSNVKVF